MNYEKFKGFSKKKKNIIKFIFSIIISVLNSNLLHYILNLDEDFSVLRFKSKNSTRRAHKNAGKHYLAFFTAFKVSQSKKTLDN